MSTTHDVLQKRVQTAFALVQYFSADKPPGVALASSGKATWTMTRYSLARYLKYSAGMRCLWTWYRFEKFYRTQTRLVYTSTIDH